jgi:hypothetical protein
MDAREFEIILRKVVREELAALVTAAAAPLPAPDPPAPRLEEVLATFAHPYSLSERELVQVERLMPPEEAKIFRTRCYAYRAAQQGNPKAAAMMRAKADKLEKNLNARRDAA